MRIIHILAVIGPSVTVTVGCLVLCALFLADIRRMRRNERERDEWERHIGS